MYLTLLLLLSLCCPMLANAAEEERPFSPTGRIWYYDSETIPLVIPASGLQATVTLVSAGRSRQLTVPVIQGRATLTLPSYALAPGAWTVSAGGSPSYTLQVVSSIPNTPFTICVYQGNIWGEKPSFYEKNTPPIERIRRWRDLYGINMLMLQHGGVNVPPAQVDLLIQAQARYSTLNTLAGQHQPDGSHNDWSDPETVESLLYRAKHLAQHLRPHGGFVGVHYADEPGLTWGVETPDGKMYDLGERKPAKEDYLGPMAVPIQRTEYKRITGKSVPNWRQPQDDWQGWSDFILWRTTVLGDAFAMATQAVKEVDPKLIGYSQIYEWSAAPTDGCYPPQQARGVDVLSTHAYTDRQLGMWYPAHETDAMRSGAWDKPLWMLPTWSMNLMPVDGVRACVYSTLAQKVEGLVWPLDWHETWPQAEEVSKRILPISGMLYHTQKLREGVGILHSLHQHIFDFSKEVTDWHGGKTYVGRLNTAWMMTQAAHFPTSRIEEEEVLAGKAGLYRVILVPGLTYRHEPLVRKLESYIAQGGIVVLDAGSTVHIKGAIVLPFAFTDWFSNARSSRPEYQDWTDRRRFDALVGKDLPRFKALIEPLVKPVVTCDNPMWMTTRQGGDRARYLWVVNMAQEDIPDANRTKSAYGSLTPRWNLTPASGKVTLPSGSGAAYDVFAGKRLDTRELTLNLDKGDAALYALLPTAIDDVQMSVRWKSPMMVLSATVTGKRKTIDAVVPLSITITAPDGTFFRTIYRATRHGKFTEELPLGSSTLHGSWQVDVKELLSGIIRSKAVKVNPSVLQASTGPVEVVDGDRIHRALRTKQEVLVLYGPETDRPAAERVATLLQKHGINALVDVASKHIKERPATRHTTALQQSGHPLTINKQVVLLGNVATNPLITRLVKQYRICPRQVNANYPGPGHALLYWAQGMFGLQNDIVTLYADDAEGLEQAIIALARQLK